MLSTLSGKTHKVITNVWIAFIKEDGKTIKTLRNVTDVTEVTFDQLDEAVLTPYIQKGLYKGIAGGYAI